MSNLNTLNRWGIGSVPINTGSRFAVATDSNNLIEDRVAGDFPSYYVGAVAEAKASGGFNVLVAGSIGAVSEYLQHTPAVYLPAAFTVADEASHQILGSHLNTLSTNNEFFSESPVELRFGSTVITASPGVIVIEEANLENLTGMKIAGAGVVCVEMSDMNVPIVRLVSSTHLDMSEESLMHTSIIFDGSVTQNSVISYTEAYVDTVSGQLFQDAGPDVAPAGELEPLAGVIIPSYLEATLPVEWSAPYWIKRGAPDMQYVTKIVMTNPNWATAISRFGMFRINAITEMNPGHYIRGRWTWFEGVDEFMTGDIAKFTVIWTDIPYASEMWSGAEVIERYLFIEYSSQFIPGEVIIKKHTAVTSDNIAEHLSGACGLDIKGATAVSTITKVFDEGIRAYLLVDGAVKMELDDDCPYYKN